MSGPTSTAASSPEPSRSFSGARLEALEQRLDDGALDDDARARPCSAGRSCRRPTTGSRPWPGRGPRRPARRRRSCHRARGETRLSRRPACAAMRLPVADEPVNEMTDTSGFSTIASPTSAAGPGHEVDDPGREAGLGHQLDEQRRAMRRVARGLEDDRVAGHEGRHHLPARDRHREVPGRDDPGDADRLADAHRPLVGQLGRDRVAEHPAALAGHQEGDVDAFLDVAARLGEDLAHLAGHRPGEALLVLRP